MEQITILEPAVLAAPQSLSERVMQWRGKAGDALLTRLQAQPTTFYMNGREVNHTFDEVGKYIEDKAAYYDRHFNDKYTLWQTNYRSQTTLLSTARQWRAEEYQWVIYPLLTWLFMKKSS